MPGIFLLDPHVADLIAAGEVVERPASVVKELMENSIDAGAGIITVEIAAGGMTYIRVTDNGCGIAPEDVKTAFLRHATSKLSGAEGLEAIGTLGFRGEALAAIAAVSRIELLTRVHGAEEGVSLTLNAGEIVDASPAGCPEGTTIIVRDLFFNTPARKKFVKSDRAEASAVASAVLRCSLSRPDVSVRFIRDGKTECHTPGDSRVDSCIYALFGREFSAGLLEAESSDETIAVKGFISDPAAARGNRSYQFFFVNGRPIRAVTLQAALEQAFANRLPSGRFPSCALYVTTKLGDVDVNVHPAKTEVKFASDKQVFDGVYYAALGALESGIRDRESGVRDQGSGIRGRESAGSDQGTEGRGAGGFRSMDSDEFNKAFVSDRSRSYREGQGSGVRGQGSGTRDQGADGSGDAEPLVITPEFGNVPFRVIGEALNTYIIVESRGSLWLIDKHAAHERLHFDALKSGDYSPMSQVLITPVICRHGHEDVSLILENAQMLDSLGFSVESFGDEAVAVRRIPADIDIGDAEPVLSEICAQLRHGGIAEPAQRDNILRAISCKAAIKAGSSSGVRELEPLAARVMSGELSQCPHGRPVAFELSGATLDKAFKRT